MRPSSSSNLIPVIRRGVRCCVPADYTEGSFSDDSQAKGPSIEELANGQVVLHFQDVDFAGYDAAKFAYTFDSAAELQAYLTSTSDERSNEPCIKEA